MTDNSPSTPSTSELVNFNLSNVAIPALGTIANVSVNLDYLSGLNPNDYRDVNPVANFIQNYLKTTPQPGDFYENIDDNLGKALVSDSQLGLSSVVNSLSVKLDVAPTVNDIPFPYSTTVTARPDGQENELVNFNLSNVAIPAQGAIANVSVNLDYKNGVAPDQYQDANSVANFIQDYLKTTPQSGDFYENIDDNLGKALVSDSQLGLSSVVNSLSVKLDVAPTLTDIPFPFSTTVTATPDGQENELVNFNLSNVAIPAHGAIANVSVNLDYKNGVAPDQYQDANSVANFIQDYLKTTPQNGDFYENIDDNLGKALVSDSQLGLSSVVNSLSVKLDVAPTVNDIPFPYSTTVTARPDGQENELVNFNLSNVAIPAQGAIANISVNLDYKNGVAPDQYRDVNPVANFIQNYLKTAPQSGDFYENIDDNLGKALISDSQLGLSSVVNSLSVKLDVAPTVDIPFPFSTTVFVNSPNQIDADLYFGRNIPGDGEVSQKQFQTFVDTVIAPLFPGLTVFDANGEVRDASGNINKEQTKIVKLVLDQTPENTDAIDNVLNTYQQQFQGAVALQNIYNVQASADPTANLIDSTSTPKLIQADLFFGRNFPGDGAVSQQQFQAFLDNTVAPRFSGLTVFDTNGEARDASGNINKEESKDVRLITDNTPENAAAISDVLQTYQQQFGGAGVFQEINQNIKAGFSADDNLIDSTSDSKEVEADLFFGRNIPGSIGQVSEQQFQAFVDDVIAPRFPGSTVFNANGEVRDANGNINQEESKVVAVFLDNTLENDAAINDVLKTYQQQFNGAGVLQVINQGIEASAGASPPVVFPDQNSLIGTQSV